MEEMIFVFVMDGDQWSCHVQGFDDLAENNFGFGSTKKEALEELLELVGPDLE